MFSGSISNHHPAPWFVAGLQQSAGADGTNPASEEPGATVSVTALGELITPRGHGRKASLELDRGGCVVGSLGVEFALGTAQLLSTLREALAMSLLAIGEVAKIARASGVFINPSASAAPRRMTSC